VISTFGLSYPGAGPPTFPFDLSIVTARPQISELFPSFNALFIASSVSNLTNAPPLDLPVLIYFKK